MQTEILELDTTVETKPSNVEMKETQAANAAGTTEQLPSETTETQDTATTEVETAKVESTSDEPTDAVAFVELDGEKIPLSQLKKWKEDFSNDSKWRDKNRRESEELNRKRQELAPLELLKPYLEQRPEILQQILTPPKQRNYESELTAHYGKRPDGTDYNAYVQWEQGRDQLIREQAKTEALFEARTVLSQEAARSFNNSLEADARTKYVDGGKLTHEEFGRAINWIVENVNLSKGQAPKEAFDVAYMVLYKDKYERDIKLDASRKAIAPILRATTGGEDAGKRKPAVTPTEEDEVDSDFINAVRYNSKGKWTKLQ